MAGSAACSSGAGRHCRSGIHLQNPILYQLLLYLLELSRLCARVMTAPPSLVAASALYLARVTLGIRQPYESTTPNDPQHQPQRQRSEDLLYWTKTLEHYTGYQVEDLRDTVLRIYRYQLQAEQLNLVIYRKYTDKQHCFASLRTAPRLDDLFDERDDDYGLLYESIKPS